MLNFFLFPWTSIPLSKFLKIMRTMKTKNKTLSNSFLSNPLTQQPQHAISVSSATCPPYSFLLIINQVQFIPNSWFLKGIITFGWLNKRCSFSAWIVLPQLRNLAHPLRLNSNTTFFLEPFFTPTSVYHYFLYKLPPL